MPEIVETRFSFRRNSKAWRVVIGSVVLLLMLTFNTKHDPWHKQILGKSWTCARELRVYDRLIAFRCAKHSRVKREAMRQGGEPRNGRFADFTERSHLPTTSLAKGRICLAAYESAPSPPISGFSAIFRLLGSTYA